MKYIVCLFILLGVVPKVQARDLNQAVNTTEATTAEVTTQSPGFSSFYEIKPVFHFSDFTSIFVDIPIAQIGDCVNWVVSEIAYIDNARRAKIKFTSGPCNR